MSYTPIFKIPVSYTDGTPLFSVDVPVEDLVDTAGLRVLPFWRLMVTEALNQSNKYVNEELLPALRSEADRAYDRAQKMSVVAGVTVTALVAGALGALYFYNRKK